MMLLLIGLILFMPQVFLFSISILFVYRYYYFEEAYRTWENFGGVKYWRIG